MQGCLLQSLFILKLQFVYFEVTVAIWDEVDPSVASVLGSGCGEKEDLQEEGEERRD